MATNSYFHHNRSEQNLVEDLTVESIKIHGKDMIYLPRTTNNKDDLFGEDTITSFEDSFFIEMYIASVDGFGGDGDFISKFGLEIRDTVELIVAKKRFQQESDMDRPREGDLIYLPLTRGLFEIKFVEHENPFYQVGKLYTYKLSCELFQYSQEDIDTDQSVIDGIEDTKKEFAYDLELSSLNGSFIFNESVTLTNGATATVSAWNGNVLRLHDVTGTLEVGTTVIGDTSLATALVSSITETTVHIAGVTSDPFDKNDEIQLESNTIFDFTDIDPFSEGSYADIIIDTGIPANTFVPLGSDALITADGEFFVVQP